MLQFEGQQHVPLSAEVVWPKLRDAGYLARCIPDGTPHDGATTEKAACTVRPGFSFVRGTMDVAIEVIEASAPCSVTYRLTSKGIGSSSEVAARLTLTPDEQGVLIQWRSEIKSLGGLLKMAPQGLIKGAAHKVIDDTWASVLRRLPTDDAR